MAMTSSDPRNWQDVAAEAQAMCDQLRRERDDALEEVSFWKQRLRSLAASFAGVICQLGDLAAIETKDAFDG